MSRKKRQSRGKEIRPTFFVFCEGETEEQYISYLRSKYRIPIIIDSKIAGNRITKKYIKNYKKGKTVHEKDRDFLIYDIDAPGILDKLKRIKDTELIASNPCLELWFLLHCQNHTAELTTRQCEEKLANHIKDYKKGEISDSLREKLDAKQEKAINRAKKLKSPNNPSTLLPRLIEVIKAEK